MLTRLQVIKDGTKIESFTRPEATRHVLREDRLLLERPSTFWNPYRCTPGIPTWSSKLQNETVWVNGVAENFEPPPLHTDWEKKMQTVDPTDTLGNSNKSLSNSPFSCTCQPYPVYRTVRDFCFPSHTAGGRLRSPRGHQDVCHDRTQCLHGRSAPTWRTPAD